MSEESFNRVSRHWHVAVYLAGLIFLTGVGWSQLDAVADQANANKDQIQESGERSREELRKLNDRLIRVEEGQKTSQDDIDEIKNDVKEILKELRQQR
jgi:peptidoglycan hydrolase CwlO-like protein